MKVFNDKKIVNTLKKTYTFSLKNALISPGDHILTGVSGGKDSLFLLEALAYIRSRVPFDISLSACHIHIPEVGYKVDRKYLQTLCNDLKIPLHFIDLSVNLQENTEKTPCFVCSWHRRKRLFDLTSELNCNKLALGHHMDDAIETLLMNMIYHGSLSSLPASLSMFGGRISLIRPLLSFAEEDMNQIAALRSYPVLQSNCPYGDKTKRNKMKEIVDQFHAIHPLSRKNIFRSMSNIFGEYLPSVER